MPSGAETWIRDGSGVHHPDLDAAAMLRLRHLLAADTGERAVLPVRPPGQRRPAAHHRRHRRGGRVAVLLGHGSGESDMRQLLLHHLETHRPDLLGRIVGIVTLDAGGLGDRALLAIGLEHGGNQPHRRPVLLLGQAVEPA
jgi:hypothetical protein